MAFLSTQDHQSYLLRTCTSLASVFFFQCRVNGRGVISAIATCYLVVTFNTPGFHRKRRLCSATVIDLISPCSLNIPAFQPQRAVDWSKRDQKVVYSLTTNGFCLFVVGASFWPKPAAANFSYFGFGTVDLIEWLWWQFIQIFTEGIPAWRDFSTEPWQYWQAISLSSAWSLREFICSGFIAFLCAGS